MGTVEGYLVVGKLNGLKHYYLFSIGKWTPDFRHVTLKDLNETKIELDMKEFPDMDPEYDHEKVIIDGNYWD
jgi:hypothetical protein